MLGQCTETPKGLMCHFLFVLYVYTINKNKISWLANISFFLDFSKMAFFGVLAKMTQLP